MGPEPRPGEVVCQVPVLVRILGTDISIICRLVRKVDILPVKEGKSRIAQGVSRIGEVIPAKVRELSLYRCWAGYRPLWGCSPLWGYRPALTTCGVLFSLAYGATSSYTIFIPSPAFGGSLSTILKNIYGLLCGSIAVNVTDSPLQRFFCPSGAFWLILRPSSPLVT